MNQVSTDFSHERSDIDEVTTQIAVTVPQAEFEKRIEAEVVKLQPQVTLKGFRKGKAPLGMVKQLHGERVRFEVSQRLISETLYQALVKEEINETVGEPELELAESKEDGDFSYTAKVFFPPKPTIEKYDSFQVELEEGGVTDEDVDKAIDEMRSSQSTFSTITDRTAAESGDVIKGNIRVGLEDEEPAAEEPFVVRLGEGRLPEELESGLLGLTVGETRTIETILPDDHRDEQLRGKKAIYIVTLDELQEQILPEVTDEFVKTLGMGAQTALELRLKVREQMEKQREQQEQTEIHAQILKELLESNPFSVPQSMIDGEIRGLLVRNGYVDPSKMDVHRMPVDTFREQLGKLAEERARTSIIVERIVEQESIEFGDEDVKKLMEEISEEHGMPVADVEKALLSDGRKANFVREQKQKKALDLLRERASIKRTKKEEK